MEVKRYMVIGLLIAFLMVSCNSSASKETISNEQDTSQLQQSAIDKVTSPLANSKIEASADTVFINGMKFTPGELHVNKGASVIWINEGIVPHDVSDFPAKAWTSDTIMVGESWEKTIDESFDYFCSIHLMMKGKIIVNK